MIIDVRSDTVTRPTTGMMEAMMQAPVGDDVFAEDESVNTLQQKAADLFGMEAALFCPSGTMTNQIAIKLHTQPGDEVICSDRAHIYLYEGGGIAFNSGASVRLLSGEKGFFTAAQVQAAINKRGDAHFANTRLVAIENTMNRGGGACWDMTELIKIRQLCQEQGLAFHLDGARLFNALQARSEEPDQYGQLFDTISICLSKGLGCPVGSLLLGTHEHIARARRIRKVLGGGMRQAGFLAAAGIYALDHHIARLQEDHQKAKQLYQALTQLDYIHQPELQAPETNIVIFKLEEKTSPNDFIQYLHSRDVKAVSMGGSYIRFVMHLDIQQDQLERLIQVLGAFKAW